MLAKRLAVLAVESRQRKKKIVTETTMHRETNTPYLYVVAFFCLFVCFLAYIFFYLCPQYFMDQRRQSSARPFKELPRHKRLSPQCSGHLWRLLDTALTVQNPSLMCVTEARNCRPGSRREVEGQPLVRADCGVSAGATQQTDTRAIVPPERLLFCRRRARAYPRESSLVLPAFLQSPDF